MAAPKSVFINTFSGIFAGWGESQIVAVRYAPDKKHFLTLADTKSAWEGKPPNASTMDVEASRLREEHRRKMGLTTLMSVPIIGCDLLSSVLYASGSVIANGGKLGPLGLICVTIMLFFYRKIYQEVVTAIPNNGGVYNALLNTSTKRIAALAACLSILSYTATAIVSGFEAIVYLNHLWPGLDIRGGTLVVLGFFAFVTSLGVTESSTVSLVIFCVHVFMLSLLLIWCVAYGFHNNWKIFLDNTHYPYPEIEDSTGKSIASNSGGLSFFFGFSAGMLGISGFESAANYVEEMAGCEVYVNTLNIMWLMSGFFNPLFSFVAMFVLSLDDIYKAEADLLAELGRKVSGPGFSGFVSIDAFLVLCGAVLTSYVGIQGLVRRLAQDKIVPGFLLQTNRRGSNHYIILMFFILSATLFLAIFDPNDPTAVNVFGGVYALAFLLVMLAFAVAALTLKLQRPTMARLVVTRYWEVGVCIVCVCCGIVGNVLLFPIILQWFFIYMACFVAVVFLMFQRMNIIQITIFVIRYFALRHEDKEKDDELRKDLVEAHKKQEAIHKHEYEEDAKAQAQRPSIYMSLSSKQHANHETGASDSKKMNGGGGGKEESAKPSDISLAAIAALSDGTESRKDVSERIHQSSSGGLSPESPGQSVKPSSYDELQPPSQMQGSSGNSLSFGVSYDFSTSSEDPSQKLNLAELAMKKQQMKSRQDMIASMNSTSPPNNKDKSTVPPAEGGIRLKSRLSAKSLVELIRAPTRFSSSGIQARRAESVTQLRPSFGLWLQTAQQLNVTSSEYTDLIPSQDKFQHTELKPMDQAEAGDLEKILEIPVLGSVMRYVLQWQNEIVSEPMVFLARSDDPICLHEALEYVKTNELTHNVIVVHFVDDRPIVNSFLKQTDDLPISSPALEDSANRYLLRAFMIPPEEENEEMKNNTRPRNDGDPNSFLLARAWPRVPGEVSQLIVNVALLDGFYSSLRVNCMIVRGSYFCPESIRWLSRFLEIPLNSMLMGMPDTNFKFPISDFAGVRVVLQPSGPEARRQTRERLQDVHAFTEQMKQKYLADTKKIKREKSRADMSMMDNSTDGSNTITYTL